MKIILYTTPSSPWCEKARAWLTEKKIEFEERDINEESQFRDEILEKTSQMAVPVIQVNDELIIGFDPEKIEAALEKSR